MLALDCKISVIDKYERNMSQMTILKAACINNNGGNGYMQRISIHINSTKKFRGSSWAYIKSPLNLQNSILNHSQRDRNDDLNLRCLLWTTKLQNTKSFHTVWNTFQATICLQNHRKSHTCALYWYDILKHLILRHKTESS